MTTFTTKVKRGKKTKINAARPEVILVIRKGLIELGGDAWFDCRDLARKVAEKGGEKDLAYEVGTLTPDLVKLGLIEYQWVWDRGRRIHYRSVATEPLLREVFDQPQPEADDEKPKKKKKKKKLVCCDAQDLVRLKSGRKKCRNCGKKFGKKKKKKVEP